MDVSTNGLVLLLATVLGVGLGALIWWFQRHAIGAIAAPLVVVILVAAILPWDVAVRQPRKRATLGDPPAREVPRPTLAKLKPMYAAEIPSHGYVGSDTCRECHPNNHASWHASYHRTMTQTASPEAVLGDFDNVKISVKGQNLSLQRHGDVCWAEMNNPALPLDVAPRVNVPIVMTTGSHHMQAYWYATGTGRTVGLLPVVFLNETQEWIPRSYSFLSPDVRHQSGKVGRWNRVCSKCHTTHRRERPRTYGSWDTYAAEFGISCEACHGPAEEHVEVHRKIAAADSQPVAELENWVDPIVNPADLSHRASSQVCGQCHSVRTEKEDYEKLDEHGSGYRPGDELSETYIVWQQDSDEVREFIKEKNAKEMDEEQLRRRYYLDGMTRVTGREYNGLINSTCHTQGEMSCLSCHLLHKPDSDPREFPEWANDQLQTEALGDAACLQCHQQDQYGTSHTHHPAGSSGSSCYNCHMPHTVYGLLKAVRNHTISNPNVAKDLEARRPNACNLCHLDKTLDWAADNLQQWYGIDPPELADDQRKVAASLLWVLKGDAAERALVAWSMGWSDAQQTSGTEWQPPFLAQLLNDDYPAIRLIARRSLKTLPGYTDLQCDPMSSEAERLDSILEVQQRWQQPSSADAIGPELLIDKETGLRIKVINRLLSERDNIKVDLAE